MDSKSTFNKFGTSPISGGGQKVQELKDVLKGRKESADPEQKQDPVPPELTGASHVELDAEIKVLKEKLKNAEEELKDRQDKLLRTMAEFENFRKRSARELDERAKFANEKLLKEMLPVLDHLELTLTHAGNEENMSTQPTKEDPFFEGIRLVVKQFLGVLEKFGIMVVEGVGAPFDPNQQEAIAVVESQEHAPGCVVSVHRKGFVLDGRVLRPAMVTIAKASGQETDNEETMH